jgi:RNA polymerase sigma-70 factor (ECF subfamily)
MRAVVDPSDSVHPLAAVSNPSEKLNLGVRDRRHPPETSGVFALPLQPYGVAMTAPEKRLRGLVDRHITFVARVLRNLGVQEAEVDDAVQRTFIVIADRLDDIKLGAEKSFLFNSARYIASHARRSNARHRGLQELDDQIPEQGLGPEELVSQKQARELLDGILESMPEDLRVVFSLFEFEQMTAPDIATLLDIPLGTVASRLRRAREDFRSRTHRLQAISKGKSGRKVGT